MSKSKLMGTSWLIWRICQSLGKWDIQYPHNHVPADATKYNIVILDAKTTSSATNNLWEISSFALSALELLYWWRTWSIERSRDSLLNLKATHFVENILFWTPCTRIENLLILSCILILRKRYPITMNLHDLQPHHVTAAMNTRFGVVK